ncbi:MAG: hypothetical protein MRY83_20320 [Flavobacteriales bacterium]|nr:hypothetical protein [Flavobacteriales bacterium]
MYLIIRRFQSQEVLAVYDNDLDSLLKKLGLFDEVNNGAFQCPECCIKITRENLGTISNENGAIIIRCLSTNCKSKEQT